MMDALGRVVAIEEIRNLHARYWRYVDTKNWPAFGATFAPDAKFTEHVTGFSWTGAEEIQAQVHVGDRGRLLGEVTHGDENRNQPT